MTNTKCGLFPDDPMDNRDDKLSETLTRLITDSYPRLSIAVLGKWGAGKSTLMASVKKRLEDKHKETTIPIWFNAWRYQKEKPLLSPLLEEIYNGVRKKQSLGTKLESAVTNLGILFIAATKSVEVSANIAAGKTGIGAKISLQKVLNNYNDIKKKESGNPFSGSLYYAAYNTLEQFGRQLNSESLRMVIFIGYIRVSQPAKCINTAIF